MTITRAGKAGVAGGSVSDLDGLKAPKGSNPAAPDSHICPKCGSEMKNGKYFWICLNDDCDQPYIGKDYGDWEKVKR